VIDEEQMQSLFNQLCHQLAGAKYPHDWWQQRHAAIARLRNHSPRLFADLVQRYRAAGRG
jgi:hypothetical protein